VSTGEGKGWAKGKTAATDARVARNADAHRGLTYRRHLSPAEDRRHHSADECVVRTLPLAWSESMAYVVGLMATDGCLISDGRHLTFDSGDEQLVRTFLQCLGRPIRYRTKTSESGGVEYQAQFGDVELYRWLGSIGLMPRKSLVLGAIDVPEEFLHPLARGLLDGDGSVVNYWYDGTGKAKGRRYEGLTTSFNSASRPHVEWLRARLSESIGVKGALVRQPPTQRGTIMWRLQYAIRESAILLRHLYPSAHVPCLHRKRLVWVDYAMRHGLPSTLDRIAEERMSYHLAS
jgi:hypothetical protein